MDPKNQTYKEKIMDAAKEAGITDLEILQVIDEEHKDSIWYDGTIAKFTINDRFQVRVFAVGEVRVGYKDNEGNYDWLRDPNEDDLAELGIHNDKELHKAINDRKVELESNNWFEFEILDKETDEYVTDDLGPDAITDDLDDALNIPSYIEWLQMEGFITPKNSKEVKKEEPIDEYDNKEEESLQEELNNYAEASWMLGQIMRHMNNEDAYYESGWLYTWPDDCTKEDCVDYFGDKESYEELRDTFEYIYSNPEYHKDGLYGASKSVVDYAHKIDKKLGLEEIEAIDTVEDSNPDYKDAYDDDSQVTHNKFGANDEFVYPFPKGFFENRNNAINVCKEYGLEYLGKDEFGDECRGKKKDLERLADDYAYSLHPGFVCPADEFDYEALKEDVNGYGPENDPKKDGKASVVPNSGDDYIKYKGYGIIVKGIDNTKEHNYFIDKNPDGTTFSEQDPRGGKLKFTSLVRVKSFIDNLETNVDEEDDVDISDEEDRDWDAYNKAMRDERDFDESLKETMSDKDMIDNLVANGTCATKKQAKDYVKNLSKEDKEHTEKIIHDKAKDSMLNDSLKEDEHSENGHGDYAIFIDGEVYCDELTKPYHFETAKEAEAFIKEHELKNAEVTRQYGKADESKKVNETITPADLSKEQIASYRAEFNKGHISMEDIANDLGCSELEAAELILGESQKLFLGESKKVNESLTDNDKLEYKASMLIEKVDALLNAKGDFTTDNGGNLLCYYSYENKNEWEDACRLLRQHTEIPTIYNCEEQDENDYYICFHFEQLEEQKKSKMSYEDALSKLNSGEWDNERFNDAIRDGEVEQPLEEDFTEYDVVDTEDDSVWDTFTSYNDAKECCDDLNTDINGDVSDEQYKIVKRIVKIESKKEKSPLDKVNIEKGHTEKEYMDKYGKLYKENKLNDFAKKDFEENKIQLRADVKYWEIDDRLFEVPLSDGLIESDKKAEDNPVEEFSNQLFDTILKTDYKKIDVDKIEDSAENPNEVDAKKGTMNINYDGHRYKINVELIESKQLKEDKDEHEEMKQRIRDIIAKHKNDKSKLGLMETDPNDPDDKSDWPFEYYPNVPEDEKKSEKDGSERYELTLSGGLNGIGEWKDYLKDLGELFKDLQEQTGLNPRVVDINNDMLDDVFTMRVNLFVEEQKESLDESLNKVKALIEKIVKQGSQYQVQSEKGKNLGTYKTKEEAEKRLKQVHYFKNMKEDWTDVFERLTKNHLSYVLHNVLDWKRSYTPEDKKDVKAIAIACHRYDNDFSADEYEAAIEYYDCFDNKGNVVSEHYFKHMNEDESSYKSGVTLACDKNIEHFKEIISNCQKAIKEDSSNKEYYENMIKDCEKEIKHLEEIKSNVKKNESVLVRDINVGDIVGEFDSEEEAQKFIDDDKGDHNYEIINESSQQKAYVDIISNRFVDVLKNKTSFVKDNLTIGKAMDELKQKYNYNLSFDADIDGYNIVRVRGDKEEINRFLNDNHIGNEYYSGPIDESVVNTSDSDKGDYEVYWNDAGYEQVEFTGTWDECQKYIEEAEEEALSNYEDASIDDIPEMKIRKKELKEGADGNTIMNTIIKYMNQGINDAKIVEKVAQELGVKKYTVAWSIKDIRDGQAQQMSDLMKEYDEKNESLDKTKVSYFVNDDEDTIAKVGNDEIIIGDKEFNKQSDDIKFKELMKVLNDFKKAPETKTEYDYVMSILNKNESLEGKPDKNMLKKAQKKHKKTWKKGSYNTLFHLKKDAGDPEKNMKIFNHMMGSDKGQATPDGTVGPVASVGASSGASSGGTAGGAGAAA